MKIEWASDFHRDGSRRSHPIASTMHGWLAKMRGTLVGNEKLRSEGMREMRQAKANRKHRKQNKSQGKSSAKGGGFSLFGSGRKPASQHRGSRNVTRGGHGSGGGSRPALRQHNSSSHRLVGQTSRRGSGVQSRGSRTPTRPGPSRRTTTTSQHRGTTPRRSSGH
ncbi:uncharacterized protein C8R40DRAFT_78939 [Lentinula edodes]|uniref:uncharacterized protein n=1 Tax=Lentinula edodes TaxID=5353 RepID=UPI001E8CC2E7|nr:uncharacterized protein C8R40DRAFT_78939 [Lentinula edodes]KAH7876886.1 hypothetical protein C8R40DRAFT_78939 [Lentinula edodes]